KPEEIVVLGDLVHRAVALPVLEGELHSLVAGLSPASKLTFLAGNHDRGLAEMWQRWKLPGNLPVTREVSCNLLMHGDGALRNPVLNRRIIMGHEHPAISIGDGVTTWQKCQCFLISESVVILPAFSR